MRDPDLPTEEPAQAQALEAELAWLGDVITAAMAHYFERGAGPGALHPPALLAHAPYALALHKWGLNAEERLVLVLALAPHVRPQVLDSFLIRNASLDQPFSEFGGHGSGHRGFWPTAETAAFLLAGDRLAARVATHRLFDAGAPLRQLGLLEWDQRPADGATLRAQLGQPLQLGREALALLLTGVPYQPGHGADFPAQRISTTLDWQHLVLAPHLQDEVEEIRAWIEHRDTLLHDWGLARRIKPGFRSLFYGPPGTGKSLTAALLGKKTGLPVYRIDLSMVVSKYIARPRKTCRACLPRPSNSTGSCSSTRPTPCSASAAAAPVPTTVSPTRRWRICCSGLKIFPAWPSWRAISRAILTKRSHAASSRCCIFRCRAAKSAGVYGRTPSRRRAGWRRTATSKRWPNSSN